MKLPAYLTNYSIETREAYGDVEFFLECSQHPWGEEDRIIRLTSLPTILQAVAAAEAHQKKYHPRKSTHRVTPTQDNVYGALSLGRCAYCGAPAGDPCRTPNGRVCKPHAVRRIG